MAGRERDHGVDLDLAEAGVLECGLEFVEGPESPAIDEGAIEACVARVVVDDEGDGVVDHARGGVGVLVAPGVVDAGTGAGGVGAVEDGGLEGFGPAVEVEDEGASAEAEIAEGEASVAVGEVEGEVGGAMDFADGEVADVDDVGVFGEVRLGVDAVGVEELDAVGDAFAGCELAGFGEGEGVEIGGEGSPEFAASEAFGDPTTGDGGGATEVFAEDGGALGVDLLEERDDGSRRLDAEFVEIVAVHDRGGWICR